MSEKISRRQFIVRSAASAAAGAGSALLPAHGTETITDATASKLKWSKAPCRFCGVGCEDRLTRPQGPLVGLASGAPGCSSPS